VNLTRTQILYGLVAAAILALAVASYFVYSGGSSGVPEEGAKLTVTLKPSDHTLGSPNAPIQFVEYGAPTCPHCSHWNAEVFPKLKKTYIDTGKVYYVFRVFALSSVDVAVEAMARCLPKSDYFQFIDMMFRNQSRWDPDGYNIPDVNAALINMGRIAGMSAERVQSCISNQAELKKISAIGEHAHKAYGINGTPSFIVDGVLTREPVTWQGAQDLINAKLKAKSQKPS
jgi:protein-disulfide isomerase